ncbi:MAG: PadR family transcriptional regulator [Phycisphaerales bacterium]|nr:MAG: PadR family transcriptional regulator [Phycisphaerales bacterium]
MDDRFELVVLSLLADGPKYGYLLTKEAKAKTDGALRLTPGVLYPLLQELEASGLITGSWEEVRAVSRDDDSGAGRKRKWYKISPKGRKRLARRVDAHRAYTAMMNAFLGTRTNSEHPA